MQRQAAKQSDKAKATLDNMIELDNDLKYIWLIFVDLFNATNGVITYSEIKAYSEINGRLTAFETRAIMRINSAKRNNHG